MIMSAGYDDAAHLPTACCPTADAQVGNVADHDDAVLVHVLELVADAQLCSTIPL
jgi:hypothetical protein